MRPTATTGCSGAREATPNRKPRAGSTMVMAAAPPIRTVRRGILSEIEDVRRGGVPVGVVTGARNAGDDPVSSGVARELGSRGEGDSGDTLPPGAISARVSGATSLETDD